MQLTAREFELLSYLVRNRGLVLTRDQILERVWGYSFPADTRTVDVHIRQLRSKLGDHAPIVTIRGVGYKADDRGAAARLTRRERPVRRAPPARPPPPARAAPPAPPTAAGGG